MELEKGSCEAGEQGLRGQSGRGRRWPQGLVSPEALANSSKELMAVPHATGITEPQEEKSSDGQGVHCPPLRCPQIHMRQDRFG